MYAYIKGQLAAKKTDRIVIETGGIGYNVFYPVGRIAMLPSIGSEVKIYTYTSVREDALQLYGFGSEEELELYKQLLAVSGIGPKVALSLLSTLTPGEIRVAILSADTKTLTPGEIRVAILSADTKTLCKAPGFGKKNAERLIVELKSKVSAEDMIGFLPQAEEDTAMEDGVMAETVQALTALGYPVKDARAAVMKASKDGVSDTEGMLKAALRYIV